MKKVLMGVALAALALTACKKDDPEMTKQEMLMGEWNVDMQTTFVFDQTNQDTIFFFEMPGFGQTYEFGSNGALTVSAPDTIITGTYTFNGTDLVTNVDGETMGGQVTTLTSNQMVFESSEVYTEDSVTYESYLKVELSK